MNCKHERIMSVNCVLYCADCGAELPADALTNKPARADKTPENGQETAKKTTRKRKA